MHVYSDGHSIHAKVKFLLFLHPCGRDLGRSTLEEALVPLNCDQLTLVTFCGCANAFCRLILALEFNFHDIVAEIGNALRKLDFWSYGYTTV